jgi:hypothetical protein
MEMKDAKSKPSDENELDEVAARIQPLPDNVVPSERFLEQVRLRLLRLEAEKKRPAAKRVA